MVDSLSFLDQGIDHGDALVGWADRSEPPSDGLIALLPAVRTRSCSEDGEGLSC